jgi:hypothetical protein
MSIRSTNRREKCVAVATLLVGRKVDHMGGSSEPGSTLPAGAGDGKPTQTFASPAPVAGPEPVDSVCPASPLPTEYVPSHPPTEGVPSHPQTDDARPSPPTQAQPPGRPAEVVRYGPGVPLPPSADQAGLTAEWVWRAGQPPGPRIGSRRWRRLVGSALTVVLLAASGVVLYLRFHHAPFQVTGVVISQQARAGCAVNVTGLISTNGSPGTVSYQWLVFPGRQPPRPLNQSVTAGQQALYTTVAVEGSGHGSASRTVMLQVLGPDPRSVSATVFIRC